MIRKSLVGKLMKAKEREYIYTYRIVEMRRAKLEGKHKNKKRPERVIQISRQKQKK